METEGDRCWENIVNVRGRHSHFRGAHRRAYRSIEQISPAQERDNWRLTDICCSIFDAATASNAL